MDNIQKKIKQTKRGIFIGKVTRAVFMFFFVVTTLFSISDIIVESKELQFFNAVDISNSTDDIGKIGVVEFELPVDIQRYWQSEYHSGGEYSPSYYTKETVSVEPSTIYVAGKAIYTDQFYFNREEVSNTKGMDIIQAGTKAVYVNNGVAEEYCKIDITADDMISDKKDNLNTIKVQYVIYLIFYVVMIKILTKEIKRLKRKLNSLTRGY